jgi:hypothetical protein
MASNSADIIHLVSYPLDLGAVIRADNSQMCK